MHAYAAMNQSSRKCYTSVGNHMCSASMIHSLRVSRQDCCKAYAQSTLTRLWMRSMLQVALETWIRYHLHRLSHSLLKLVLQTRCSTLASTISLMGMLLLSFLLVVKGPGLVILDQKVKLMLACHRIKAYFSCIVRRSSGCFNLHHESKRAQACPCM